MRFSIILPVFNREAALPYAIESVLAQDFADWELVIVDDASTDGTFGVCEGYAMRDPRIRVLQCEVNKGPSGARNLALGAVQGERIMFLDSDDVIAADLLSSVDEVLREDDPDLVVFGSFVWLPPEDLSGRMLDRSIIRDHVLPDHMGVSGHSKYFMLSFVTNKCFRRSLIEAHGLRFIDQRRVWEDNVFSIGYFDVCDNVYAIRRTFYKGGPVEVTNHLSAEHTPDKLWNYIDNVERCQKVFGDEYDFDSAVASDRRFEVLSALLPELLDALPMKESMALLRKLVGNATARSWVEHFVPKGNFERAFRRSFLAANALSLYLLIRLRPFVRSLRNKLGKRRHL